MGIALICLIAMVLLSAFLMPAFGIPGLFYAWLVANILVALVGIISLVLQKEH